MVALRDAAGARRPRQRAEISLRGRRDRPRPAWRQFRTITFPYIRGLLLLALLFRTIEAFKLFDVVFLLTDGGPGTSTETIALCVYRVAFQYFKTSESTALAYILLFIVIVLTNLYLYFATTARPGGGARMARTCLRSRRASFGWTGRSSACATGCGCAGATGVGEAGWGRTLLAPRSSA